MGLKKKKIVIKHLYVILDNFFALKISLINLGIVQCLQMFPLKTVFCSLVCFSSLFIFFFGTFVHSHSSDSSQHCSLRPSG